MIYPEINLKSTVPLYIQLKRAYQRLAALGLIQPDEKLPSVRELATALGINPNTVHKAFSELEQEHLIYAIPGKGNYLCDGTRNDRSFEKQEILRNFYNALQIAWTAGFSETTVHELLNEAIQRSKASGSERP